MSNNAYLSTTAVGRWGEDLAEQALQAHGYELVERNWRCAGGEIDIIARHLDDWVFVEVKTRSSDKYGSPEEALTPAKQRRLYAAVELYLAEKQTGEVNWRIDLVAIELAKSGKVYRLDLYQNAVILSE